MALKHAEIQGFRAKDTLYKKADEKGLSLWIFPNGSKRWNFKYRFGGKEKAMALGVYPETSLADARKKRDEARRVLLDGQDPMHARKMKKIADSVNAGNSFATVGEEFITVKLVNSQKAPATIEKARWYLAHLLPALGSRPIAEIAPAELLAVLKTIEKKGKRETAVRTRALASRIFRYGVATTRCNADPAALLTGALSAPIVKSHAAILDPKRLGEFLRSVDTFGGSPIVKLAMQILPHVMLRPGELRFARWDEIDLEQAIWRIPAERTKQRRPHAVPISTQVLVLLGKVKPHSIDDGFLFPGERTHLKPISENAMNAAYRRMGFGKEEVTAHGFRSTASTMLNESGKWQPDAIERALAHGDSDAIRGKYNRGHYWEERVPMMQWWSDYLDKVKAGGDVIPIRKESQQ